MSDSDGTAGTDWMGLEEAATALGCSTRTVYRRAARGELLTRSLPDGTRLVAVPRVSRTDRQVAGQMLERLDEQTTETRQLARAAMVAGDRLADAYAEQLRQAEGREQAARTAGRLAWTAAAAVTVSAIGGAVWGWTVLDGSRSRELQLDVELRQAADTVSQREAELGRLAAELAEARQLAAEARDRAIAAEAAAEVAGARAELAAGERERLAEERDRTARRLDELQARMTTMLTTLAAPAAPADGRGWEPYAAGVLARPAAEIPPRE